MVNTEAEDMVLNLDFCVRKTSSCQYYLADGRLLVTEVKCSEAYLTTRLHYALFFRVEEAYNAISMSLDRLGVHSDDQFEYIDTVIRKAQRLCEKNIRTEDHTDNRMLCYLDVHYDHLAEERQESTDDEDEGMESADEWEDSMEDEDDEGMVPAALPAIRSLGATRIKVEEGMNVEQCIICQEEYCDGEKVTCMPCLHMFHQDCITKWLLRSHFCPICKFQMPTCY